MPPLRTERPPWMPRTPAQYGAAYAAARADGQRRRRRANETFLEFILRTGHRIVPGCDWCEQRGEDCIMSVYSVRCFGCCRDTVQCSHNPDELASGRNVRSGGARGANRSARGRASVGIRPGYASRYLDDSEEDEYEVEPEPRTSSTRLIDYPTRQAAATQNEQKPDVRLLDDPVLAVWRTGAGRFHTEEDRRGIETYYTIEVARLREDRLRRQARALAAARYADELRAVATELRKASDYLAGRLRDVRAELGDFDT